MSKIKEKFFKLLIRQAKNAGLPAVKNLVDEKGRLDEINRLNLVDRELTNEKYANNITELACYLTGKPQCSINLLTDKSQFSKNNHGFKIPEKMMLKEIPRDISMCQYVLEFPKEQLTIENVRENLKTQNFHKMPLAPDIQFYSGTPIITSRGFTIGTLCITDKKPGKLNHNQTQGLRLLADQLSNLLETSQKQSFTTNLSKEINKKTDLQATFFSSATILFTDFVGFTKITEVIQPGELIESLDDFFKSFDQVIEKHELKKVKTIGDSYMAVGGIPEGKSGHPISVCMAGMDIVDMVSALNKKRIVLGQEPWDIRVGIHTGPIIGGVLETGFDIWGDAVNIASRLESTSKKNRVHISNATREFLATRASVTNRGYIDIKNKGKMETFFLDSII